MTLNALPAELEMLAALAVEARQTARNRDELLAIVKAAFENHIGLRSLFYAQPLEVLRFMDMMAPERAA